jgi:glycine dehydrogenase subunit 1
MDQNENREMLSFLGLGSVEELFADIPEKFRLNELNLPDGMSELQVLSHLRSILSTSTDCSEYSCFLGGGVYDTFIPAIVQHVVGRSELYTSYTPYQSELSQGLLQLIFEYQSLLTELTGMDVINASLYDGASALGEAACMCGRISDGSFFLIPSAMAPWKKSVLSNYVSGMGLSVREYPFNRKSGQADLHAIADIARKGAAGVYIEMPNFLGLYQEDIMELKGLIGDTMLVAGVNPLSLATVMPPGEYGADIVVGEGQPLGLNMNFGGPFLGIFGCRREHVRKMPGRIVGATVDAEGRRSFCLTLQAREQHIRRSKATSNVCTNQTLLAVAASVYIAAMGPGGLADVANRTEGNRLMAMKLFEEQGVEIPFRGPGFNEFVSASHSDTARMREELLKHRIIGGLPLDGVVPGMENAVLWAVSETTSGEEIARLARLVGGFK